MKEISTTSPKYVVPELVQVERVTHQNQFSQSSDTALYFYMAVVFLLSFISILRILYYQYHDTEAFSSISINVHDNM